MGKCATTLLAATLLACSSAEEDEEFEQALEVIKQELDDGRSPTPAAEPGRVEKPSPVAEPEADASPGSPDASEDDPSGDEALAGEKDEEGPGLSSLEVKGALGPRAVARVIRRQRPRAARCYREGRSPDAQGGGEASLSWRISGGGRVERVTVEKTPVDLVNVSECLRAAIKSWRFPKSKGRASTRVSYTFDFGSDVE